MKCRVFPCSPALLLLALWFALAMPARAEHVYYASVPSPLSSPVDLGNGYTAVITGTNVVPVSCDGEGSDAILFLIQLAPPSPSQEYVVPETSVYVTLLFSEQPYLKKMSIDVEFRLSGTIGPERANIRCAVVSGLPATFYVGGKQVAITPGFFLPPCPVGITASGGFSFRIACGPPPGYTTISSFTVDPIAATAGGYAIGQVTLDRNAPIDGCLVNLASSNPAIALPSQSVFVPAGQKSASFPIAVRNVGTASLSATLNKLTTSTPITARPRALVCVGDLNLDSRTDLSDAINLLRVVAGLDPAPPCM